MKKGRKEEILDTFEKMVTQYGLDKITMRDIAEEVGISVGAIYLDFANKEALLEAIENRWTKLVDNKYDEVLISDDTIKQKLYKLTAGHVIQLSKMISINRGMLELMMGTLRIKYIRKKMVTHREVIQKIMTAKIAKLLRYGVSKGNFVIEDVDTTAKVIINAFGVYFFASFLINRDTESVKKDAEDTFNFIWNAIKK